MTKQGVEERLTEYYEKQRRRDVLAKQLALTDERIGEIDAKIMDENLYPSQGVARLDGNSGNRTAGHVANPTALAAEIHERMVRDFLEEKAEMLRRKNNLQRELHLIETEITTIEEALDTITEDMREVIRLRYKQRKSVLTIAIERMIDESTLRYRLARALARLARFLTANEDLLLPSTN